MACYRDSFTFLPYGEIQLNASCFLLGLLFGPEEGWTEDRKNLQ
jgi:hypothetical protein